VHDADIEENDDASATDGITYQHAFPDVNQTIDEVDRTAFTRAKSSHSDPALERARSYGQQTRQGQDFRM
jgi:hypothetical protein